MGELVGPLGDQFADACKGAGALLWRAVAPLTCIERTPCSLDRTVDVDLGARRHAADAFFGAGADDVEAIAPGRSHPLAADEQLVVVQAHEVAFCAGAQNMPAAIIG
ncbi:unannotated protein [freshwater metagenome]|uniref:Unannotated protein n=1 Tax=freshwater metagenome TaxID=449393 RepID=A0A6J7CAV5_9ZZZZ